MNTMKKTLPDTPVRTRKQQLTDDLGYKIVSGEIPAGTVLQLDSIASHSGFSMSVVREAVTTLASLGLVESRKKLGTVVQKEKAWNHMSPEVIRWRLEDPTQRLNQFSWLVELRSALEPLAAQLAAKNRSDKSATQLRNLAKDLVKYGASGDLESFMKADLKFHQLILAQSQNPLVNGLSQYLDVLLRARHFFGLMPPRPDVNAVHFHEMLTEAITKQSPDRAHKASVMIVDQATDEFFTDIAKLGEPGTDWERKPERGS